MILIGRGLDLRSSSVDCLEDSGQTGKAESEAGSESRRRKREAGTGPCAVFKVWKERNAKAKGKRGTRKWRARTERSGKRKGEG